MRGSGRLTRRRGEGNGRHSVGAHRNRKFVRLKNSPRPAQRGEADARSAAGEGLGWVKASACSHSLGLSNIPDTVWDFGADDLEQDLARRRGRRGGRLDLPDTVWRIDTTPGGAIVQTVSAQSSKPWTHIASG